MSRRSGHAVESLCLTLLAVLSCSGKLDTPLHTATLLSMLKMAQQLALAEADLQQQQQTLEHQHQQQQQQQQAAPAMQRHQQQLAAAADMLVPPALGVLRLIRHQGDAFVGRIQDDYRSFMQHYFVGLHDVALEQGCRKWRLLGSSTAVVSVVMFGFWGGEGGW
jgi:hypothetical protein